MDGNYVPNVILHSRVLHLNVGRVMPNSTINKRTSLSPANIVIFLIIPKCFPNIFDYTII
jgi:hypothetical protein